MMDGGWDDDPRWWSEDADEEPTTCDNCGGDADADDGPEAGHETPGGWWCRRCVAEEENEENEEEDW